MLGPWGSLKDEDRPPKSSKPVANFIPGKKNLRIKKNLCGAQKAYQLAETTARDGFL